MPKYVYPAVFHKEGDCYLVHFPDIKNCFTDGEDLADAMDMASDVLGTMLYGLEEDGTPIPAASAIQDVTVTEEGDFVSLVSCDTLEYRKLNDHKATKKTLTIPSWLNTIAEKNNINFSAVLQAALIEKLGLGN